MSNGTLTMRPAVDADGPAIARLVGKEADPLAGDVLLAELDGYVIAALSIGDDRAVADSFRPTAGIVGLLRERREQLLAARAHSFAFTPERPRGVERLVGLWRAPVPA